MRGIQRGKEPTESEIDFAAYVLRNTDGNVSFKAFLKMNRFMKNKEDHIPVGVFKLFDIFNYNNNEMLSWEEFKYLSDTLFENTGSRAFELNFTNMDVNQDNKISLVEFVQGVKNAGFHGEDFKPISTSIEEKKPLRQFRIKNVQGRVYAVWVAKDGIVLDLLEALQDALDQSKAIGELLYQGEIQPKTKQLSKLDNTTKFSLTEKRTIHEPLTAEEYKIAINLGVSKDDAEFLKSIFLGFDLNEDGKISKEELTCIMRGLKRGKEPTKAELSGVAFFLGDTAGNLCVSFEDFLRMNRVVRSK